MRSHFLVLGLFALFVSVVFAALMRDDPESQLRFGGMLFAGFVVGALALGWLMYPLPF